MSATAKFMFNVDFGRREPEEEKEPTITVAAHQVALTEAEANGYQKGFSAAAAEATVETERRIAAALEAICDSLKAIEARLEAEAVEVAVAVAKKLAPELVSREPLAEISALASECFRHLVGSPHVVVRVAEPLYEHAHTRLTEIARNHGFEGRVVVLAAPEVELGDCRIEWADGGTVRDTEARQKSIEDAVSRYIAARQGPLK